MAEAGDFAAVAPLHTAAMLRVAAALVGRADAEDAAQEALTRAWQAWETLRDPGAVRPWLLRITVNVCRQWQRGGFGRRVRATQPLPEENDYEALALLDADLGTSDHTGSLDLRAAINGLEPALRVIVALRYYGGMDATEIGLALNTPPGTVRTRLRRALAQLRNALGSSAPPASGPERGNPMSEDTWPPGRSDEREDLPHDLRPIDGRLTTDALIWLTRLPETDRLDAHARALATGTTVAERPWVTSRQIEDDGEPATHLRGSVPPRVSRARLLVATVAAVVVVSLLSALLAGLLGRQNEPGTKHQHGPVASPTASSAPTQPSPSATSTTVRPTATPSATAILTGPGGAPTATPGASVVRVVKTITTSNGYGGPVSASCPAGSIMISGGYDIENGYPGMTPYDNYPASKNSWEVSVSADYPSGALVSAYADCLRATAGVSTEIVSGQSSNPGTITATCPAGSVLTGGGHVSDYFGEEQFYERAMPQGNMWIITAHGPQMVGPRYYTADAICLRSSRLETGSIQSEAASVSPAHLATLALTCPNGQTLTGGGYSDGRDASTYQLAYSLDGLSAWNVRAYNDDTGSGGHSHTFSAYAVCLLLG